MVCTAANHRWGHTAPSWKCPLSKRWLLVRWYRNSSNWEAWFANMSKAKQAALLWQLWWHLTSVSHFLSERFRDRATWPPNERIHSASLTWSLQCCRKQQQSSGGFQKVSVRQGWGGGPNPDGTWCGGGQRPAGDWAWGGGLKGPSGPSRGKGNRSKDCGDSEAWEADHRLFQGGESLGSLPGPPLSQRHPMLHLTHVFIQQPPQAKQEVGFIKRGTLA